MRNCLLLASSAVALVLMTSPVMAQSSSGNLTLGREVSASFPDEGTDYRIRLRPGQRIEAVFRSNAVDAYLQLFDANDLTTALVEDDDGLGEGTDSRLRYASRDGGEFVVRVGALGFDEAGTGTLVVRQIEAVREPRAERLTLGRTANGTLNSRSPESEDGHRFDLYRIRLSAGERIAISQRSDDFDSLVAVGRTVNGVFEELGRNDDGANMGLNSYLVFSAPAAGEYDIRAQSYGKTPSGSYELEVTAGPPRPRPTPFVLGTTASDTLSDKSSVSASGGYAAYYSFEAVAGQAYGISAESDDFDTVIEVYDATDVSVASDDDSGGNLNSSLMFTPRTSGTYTLEVRAYGSGQGDFEAKIEEVAPPPAPKPLSLGDKVDDELEDSSASSGGNKRYEAFSVQLAEGQRIQVIMRSSDFDTVLEIGEDGETFEAIESDDDGLGQGTDSRLLFTAPSNGTYIIRGTSYGGDGRGDYTLELSDRGPEPQAGSILIGATARASLSEQDNASDSGAYYDDYIFDAKANDRLRLTMVAPAFDAVVVVGEMRNGSFRELDRDDDGLSDTHARLNWTVPREGQYVARATSYAPNVTGEYILTVERQP